MILYVFRNKKTGTLCRSNMRNSKFFEVDYDYIGEEDDCAKVPLTRKEVINRLKEVK